MVEIELNAGNFDGIIKGSDLPVLVDFWAPWCGPCRMLAPTIENLGEKYAGKVNICKVDVDEQPELAQRFGVMSIPTIIAFQDGQPFGKLVGVRPQAELEALLK